MQLLILDVDGVMTDGTKIYSEKGVIAKRFCDQDWTAITRFKEDGVSVCFLSADRNVTEKEAKRRGIDFWYSRNKDGTIDKVRFIDIFKNHYCVSVKDMAYVGDDLFDMPMMQAINSGGGHSYCPLNACADLYEERVAIRLPAKCGEYVVAELYRMVKAGLAK